MTSVSFTRQGLEHKVTPSGDRTWGHKPGLDEIAGTDGQTADALLGKRV